MATRKKTVIAPVEVQATTPEEILRAKIADIHTQAHTLNLSRFNPPLEGELLVEYESLSARGTTKPSEWAEFYIRAARVRAGLATPTAPGETGNAPLTRPTQRNESKWQQ